MVLIVYKHLNSFVDVFYVGPIMPQPARKLPDDLEIIMQESGEYGVIIISFGSDISSLNDEAVTEMMEALGQMKQTTIWKVTRKFSMLLVGEKMKKLFK